MSLINCLVSGTSFIHNYITQAFRSWQTLTGSLSHILAESQQEFYLTSSDTVPLFIRKKYIKYNPFIWLGSSQNMKQMQSSHVCLFFLALSQEMTVQVMGMRTLWPRTPLTLQRSNPCRDNKAAHLWISFSVLGCPLKAFTTSQRLIWDNRVSLIGPTLRHSIS